MRLSTITNWAYGATVALTLASGGTMLLAASAQERERDAVEQRYRLDKATSRLGSEVYALSDHARQYLNTGDPTYKVVYGHDLEGLATVEQRIDHIDDAGASANELALLENAVRQADTLHDEQILAIDAFEAGNETVARQILFGAEYERQLDQVQALIVRFQDLLDRRTERTVQAATEVARLWKTVSEIVIAITGILFLCVLYFIFKQRVLRPVVKLSDIVGRLAEQDYTTELPDIDQIDEIGDMAKAVRIFRENGLERQRLEAERDVDLATQNRLLSMTQRMQSCDTLDDLLYVVKSFIPSITPGHAGRLYLLEDQRNAMVASCDWLGPRHSASEFPPSACWALRRGLPHRPANGNVDVPCHHLRLEGSKAPDTLCLPITAQGERLGLLYLEARDDETEKSTISEVYLNMLVENIALALANLRLSDALREMAMVDALTGLANRHRLDETLTTQAARLAREGKSLSCLMIDIDHFKRFNDKHGHEAGDLVLQEVGGVLKSSVRETERAFRYGGEEFLLLLPEVNVDAAARRAEEIRAKIAALQTTHIGKDLGTITVSVGVATAPEHCHVGVLVPTADAVLLKAKRNGRDRVEIAQLLQDHKTAG
ncbi:diguanylate cyclase [Aurantiacibacter flavus]